MHQLVHSINQGAIYICALMVSVSVTATLLQVFCRYVLNSSLNWPEELSRILLIWIVFLGSGVAVFRKEHASLGLVVDKLPEKYQQIVKMITKVVLMVSVIILASY